MTQIDNLQMLPLAEAIRGGRLTASLAAADGLQRIATHNEVLRAFITVDSSAAHHRAGELDASMAAGGSPGRLHGVPLAVKDLIQMAGHATSAGSTVYNDVATEDAPVIARLRRAGAVLLGTLNMDEFAAGGTGFNAHFGRCCNPWDPQRITGGSSSGSAAAVAAGLVPATLGSDTGGSARVPAAYCGVTAIKTSYGRVSLQGVFPRTPPFDSLAPMARSVEDCQALLAVIESDGAMDTEGPTLEQARDQARTLRLGISIAQFADGMDPAVERCLTTAARVMASAAQTHSRIHLPDVDLMTGLHQAIVKSEGARIHREVLRTRAQAISLAARGAMETGLFIDPAAVGQALAVRAGVLSHFLSTAFADADVLLLPVTMSVAPRAEDVSQASASDIVAFFAQSGRACRFVNYLGLPALSLPCGFVEGLPVGLQLVGRPNREDQLFALGRAYQQLSDFHLQTPPAFS